jgi:hypothetical protein
MSRKTLEGINPGSDSILPQMEPKSLGREEASPEEEWERFRPLIEQLYMGEGKTLQEVMSVLSKFGHRGTYVGYPDIRKSCCTLTYKKTG